MASEAGQSVIRHLRRAALADGDDCAARRSKTRSI